MHDDFLRQCSRENFCRWFTQITNAKSDFAELGLHLGNMVKSLRKQDLGELIGCTAYLSGLCAVAECWGEDVSVLREAVHESNNAINLYISSTDQVVQAHVSSATGRPCLSAADPLATDKFLPVILGLGETLQEQLVVSKSHLLGIAMRHSQDIEVNTAIRDVCDHHLFGEIARGYETIACNPSIEEVAVYILAFDAFDPVQEISSLDILEVTSCISKLPLAIESAIRFVRCFPSDGAVASLCEYASAYHEDGLELPVDDLAQLAHDLWKSGLAARNPGSVLMMSDCMLDRKTIRNYWDITKGIALVSDSIIHDLENEYGL